MQLEPVTANFRNVTNRFCLFPTYFCSIKGKIYDYGSSFKPESIDPNHSLYPWNDELINIYLGPSCLKCCKSTHCYTFALCKLRLFALNRSHVVPFYLFYCSKSFTSLVFIDSIEHFLGRENTVKGEKKKRREKKKIKFNSSPCPWRCGCLSA